MSSDYDDFSDTSLALRPTGGLMEQVAPVAEPSSLETISRVELDVQISTAKKYPRSIEKFTKDMESMISFSPEVAEKCTFTLPKKDKDGKFITGPSVRLAEIAFTAWGNLQVGSRFMGDNGTFVTVQGLARDMERNNAASADVVRRITNKDGKRYGDDMISVTIMAAQAIARRNAIFQVIPRAYINYFDSFSRHVVRQANQDVAEKTDKAIHYLAGLGVPELKVLGVLGISKREDMTVDLLSHLRGFCVAIKEGHTTVEEAFPGAKTAQPAASQGGLAAKIQANTGTAPVKPTVEPAPDLAPKDEPADDEPPIFGQGTIRPDSRSFSQVFREAVGVVNETIMRTVTQALGSVPPDVMSRYVVAETAIAKTVYASGIAGGVVAKPIPLNRSIVPALEAAYGEHRAFLRLTLHETLDAAFQAADVALEAQAAQREPGSDG